MKSVTIRDDKGMILIKVLERKNGTYDILQETRCLHLKIEIRDDKNQKVSIVK